MAETGPPKAFPIKLLEDLGNRSYFESPHFVFNKSSVPLPHTGASSREKRPRLLACHDMKGGYLDDQWIQGSGNADAYTLTHWHLLDSFVYFSHNLVTLPPPGWTNAAHRHGVQVLGTFLTEMTDGAQVCKELLVSEKSARMYADRLAELAHALGFDGWLVNIENVIEKQKVSVLQEFVRHLTESMHALVPQSLVIWYDSVTIDGRLNWQNRLNTLNKPFFDVCDGIFTNYSWRINFPKLSSIVAEDRPFDVYMGVDVFGRNTFGGGGYNCDVALKVAREAGVSAALFAPGWTYELNLNQVQWWESIENCWTPARPDPVQLPFFTDFDIGCGREKFMDGKLLSDFPWNNLSCQNLQPQWEESTQHQVIVAPSQGPELYSGGVCLKVTGNVGGEDVYVVKLYKTEVVIKEALLDVSYSVMVQGASNFCLALVAKDLEGSEVIHFLLDSKETHDTCPARTYEFPHVSVVFHDTKYDDSVSKETFTLKTLEEKNSLNVQSGSASDVTVWSMRRFLVEWGQHTLTHIFGICSIANGLQPILIKLLQDKDSIFDWALTGSSRMLTNHDFKQTGRGDSIGQTARRFLQGSKQADNPSQLKENNVHQPWYKFLFSLFSPKVEEATSINPRNGNFSVNLGHISIASSDHVHWLFPNPELTGRNQLWAVGEDGGQVLSINLGWVLPSNKSSTFPVVERYHLYVDMDVDASGASGLRYLGMTMLGAFYVYILPVPKAFLKVTFYLQRQCGCGKMQPLSDFSKYTLRK